jgi:ADP-heptose:LPS heptosyltransferase
MDILIVKLGALGDVVNTLPLAISLKKHFDARIHWITEPLSFPLLARHSHVDRVILFDRSHWMKSLPEVMGEIRGQRFDLALDLQRLVKSSVLCMAASAGRRIGFDALRCKEMTWIMPFERIAPADPGNHMVTQYLDFARHLGIEPGDPQWNIPAGDAPPRSLPQDYAVLNIGATKPANRWSAQGFSLLARLIMERYSIRCVLTGGRQDMQTAAQVMALAEVPVVNLVGRTTIPQLISVLSGARAVVSCDTGPMHLAVALGREVVALFGPADPRRTGPYRGQVVRASLPCAPCNRKTCGNPVCMEAITPEDVLEKIGRAF